MKKIIIILCLCIGLIQCIGTEAHADNNAKSIIDESINRVKDLMDARNGETINEAIPKISTSKKTLEVTITGYTVLYQMYMSSMEQKTSLKREWIDDEQAMIQLTDTSLCMVSTESQSDFSNITEVLHTAAPESRSDLLSARCSMVSTILVFDPDLDVKTITEMVMNILPEKGEYTTKDCRYKYVESYNVIMLYIFPK